MSVRTTRNVSSQLEFADSAALLDHPEALCARADRDGYLFFRGLLPAAQLSVLRSQMMKIVERHGWRRQDATADEIDVESINRVPPSDMRLDIGVSAAAYDEVQRLESLHRLPHHPRLLSVFGTLFDKPAFVHPRHIARMITPHHAMSPTPPHQDFPLIQGSIRTWTCWFPLADCPREHGGLSVLRGSHREGCLPVTATHGAGGIAVQLCPDETEWVSGDFNAGDVLAFTSHTVHKALPCLRKRTIRLSLDVRYQAVDEPIEAKSLLPHCALTWDQIYAGWLKDDLKYYWNRTSPTLSPWDDALTRYDRRIC